MATVGERRRNMAKDAKRRTKDVFWYLSLTKKQATVSQKEERQQ